MIAVPPVGDGLDSALAVVWAKSWPYDRSRTRSDGGPVERWLPLWQHLDDTADVAALLWDQWLAPSVKDLVAASLPAGDDDARRLVAWLAGVHDVGKASPAFAVQVPVLCDRMTDRGLPTIGPSVHTDRSTLRHEVAGAAALDRWLARRAPGLGRHSRERLTVVVAGHHGSFVGLARVRRAPERGDLFGEGGWVAVQDALVDRAADRAGVTGRWPDWDGLRLSPTVQILLTGLVVMADWIASADDYFPLLPLGAVPAVPAADDTDGGVAPGRPLPPGQGVADLAAAPDRVRQAWAELGLHARWRPRVPGEPVTEVFARRFPSVAGQPRPVQKAAARLAGAMPADGMMIIEAPMGEGKTEAALLAAEVLAARSGASGLFVALPTQATTNAMFDRVLDWLGTASADEQGRTVALVHGKAPLHEGFARLPRTGGSGRGDLQPEDADNLCGTHSPAERYRASLHEWFVGRKRRALSDVAVGTIDQVLFAALRARHLVLRHLALTTKVVVIDEVHAADVFMSRFLDRALEWLGAAGTPVVLLSATLPAERRAELYLAHERGRRRRLMWDEPEERDDWGPPEPGGRKDPDLASRERLGGDLGYPCLVVPGGDGPQVEVIEPSGRSVEVRLTHLDDDLDLLANRLAEDLREGGCAVVVRNTIRRVQETAEVLTQRFGAGQITVAHAGYLAADRAAKDAELLRCFGPPAPDRERPARHVVVASQVVEQSLDVDFDLMVTDLAPVDLVLQRMGRLHRHTRTDRPGPVREARCYLVGADWTQVPPQPDRGSRTVYGDWPLLRSAAVLASRREGGVVRLPQDIAPLVQVAYAPSGGALPGWEEALANAWQTALKDRSRRERKADAFALPSVTELSGSLFDLDRVGAGDVDEDSPSCQGHVRDGADSIEVVVVQRGTDGQDRVPDWTDGGGERLPLRHVPPSDRQARALARCTLRLPSTLTRGETGNTVIGELERDWFEGWAKARLLSGQLALVLDDDRRRTLADREVRYDLRLGLVVSRAGR